MDLFQSFYADSNFKSHLCFPFSFFLLLPLLRLISSFLLLLLSSTFVGFFKGIFWGQWLSCNAYVEGMSVLSYELFFVKGFDWSFKCLRFWSFCLIWSFVCMLKEGLREFMVLFFVLFVILCLGWGLWIVDSIFCCCYGVFYFGYWSRLFLWKKKFLSLWMGILFFTFGFGVLFGWKKFWCL